MGSRHGGESTREQFTETWRTLRDGGITKQHAPKKSNAVKRAEQQYRWFITGLSIGLIAVVVLAGVGLYSLIF